MPLDRVASKLLAHADRWRDDAALSRDLIDLATHDGAAECIAPVIHRQGQRRLRQ